MSGGLRDNYGRVVTNLHNNTECVRGHCPLHNPSDHPLRDWRLRWNADGEFYERVCQHSVGHPDPDLDPRPGHAGQGCDGCCYWGHLL